MELAGLGREERDARGARQRVAEISRGDRLLGSRALVERTSRKRKLANGTLKALRRSFQLTLQGVHFS